MNTTRPTLYYLCLESDYSSSDQLGIFRDRNGAEIYRGSNAFLEAAAIEGSARTNDGRILNYAGGAKGDERWRFVAGAPYGVGSRCPLVPLKSIAVDPSVIPLGSVVRIPKLQGLVLPDGSVHDGIVYALDTGGAIKGDRIDIFTGLGRASMKALYNHGIDHLKPLEYLIIGKQATCPKVPEIVEPQTSGSEKTLTPERIIEEMKRVLSKYLGQTESQGPNRSPLIDQINNFMHVALGSPYCLSGIQWSLLEVEKNLGCDFQIPLTAHCQTFYNRTPDSLKHQTPKAGDIGIFKRVGSSSGHAVFVKEVLNKNQIKTIEFNTGPEVHINRDGDGCYEKTREIAGSGLMRLMGFVRVVDSVQILEKLA